MTLPSPVQQIKHPLFNKYNLKVFIKRDDLIHPIISGNKWRKLKHNILFAKEQGYLGILSFGGAYSNHIHALAYAAKEQGILSKGIIRGEQHYQTNATLSQAISWGMSCDFVDRKTYRLRQEPQYLANLQSQYPDYFIVPEGGSNTLALPGVGEVLSELNAQLSFDTLMLPVGSGGTFAGLIHADNNQHNLLGIAVLKEAHHIEEQIKALLDAHNVNAELVEKLDKGTNTNKPNWQLLDNFHRGGYAKFSVEDEQRMYQFVQDSGITFEPVYSGKMLLALLDLISDGYFKEEQTIVLLHTGGLQGINGLIEQKKLSTPLSLKS